MISLKLRAILLIAVIIYYMIVFHLLREKRLHLKYTLLWLLSGAAMLILSVFPRLISVFSNAVGIYDPVNALFAAIMFFVIIILMSLTAIVSKLNDKNKRLIQVIAILEKRVRELEESKTNSDVG